MTINQEDCVAALGGLSDALAADGYLLSLSVQDADKVRVAVEAGPDACADCLVPKGVFEGILRSKLPTEVGAIELVYPVTH
jgi:hypothetical protein